LKQHNIVELDEQSVFVSCFCVKKGVLEPRPQPHYILTNTVEQNLGDLARIVSHCDYPVLVKGDTSVGETSLVTYLANITGNTVVSVNNHEHTDTQELFELFIPVTGPTIRTKPGFRLFGTQNPHSLS